MSKATNTGTICKNRRARYDYELINTFEGGLMLVGTEVKSIRAGNVQISEAYASFLSGELWLINAHIAPYPHAGQFGHEERRDRKILLHKKELLKMQKAKEAKGLTLVPVSLYWKNGKVKIALALGRGKKNIDKRATIKARDWDRQKHRILKG